MEDTPSPRHIRDAMSTLLGRLGLEPALNQASTKEIPKDLQSFSGRGRLMPMDLAEENTTFRAADVPIAWFDSFESWYSTRCELVEPGILGQTFDEWQSQTHAEASMLRARGSRPVLVRVDPRRLKRWCDDRREPLDRLAICRYVEYRLHERLAINADQSKCRVPRAM
jgi:hypothetical protein